MLRSARPRVARVRLLRAPLGAAVHKVAEWMGEICMTGLNFLTSRTQPSGVYLS